jgi:hypothetical protein
MRWMTLLLPAAAGAFLVTASCSKNKGPEEATPEAQPSAAAPSADTTNTAAAGAAVDSTAAMADSTAGAMRDTLTAPTDSALAPHDSM